MQDAAGPFFQASGLAALHDLAWGKTAIFTWGLHPIFPRAGSRHTVMHESMRRLFAARHKLCPWGSQAQH